MSDCVIKRFFFFFPFQCMTKFTTNKKKIIKKQNKTKKKRFLISLFPIIHTFEPLRSSVDSTSRTLPKSLQLSQSVSQLTWSKPSLSFPWNVPNLLFDLPSILLSTQTPVKIKYQSFPSPDYNTPVALFCT